MNLLRSSLLLCFILVCSVFSVISSSPINNTPSITADYETRVGKISGSLSFANKASVQYAIVYIQSLNKYASSDEDGMFEIHDVPYGKYTLEVKTIEAEPTKVDIEVNKKTLELSLVLEKNADFNLSEIVVWGKSETDRIKEKGFAVNVIETQKVAVQSVRTIDLLDRTAGVRIRQSGGIGSQAEYNINGLSGSSVRIFIDGIPMRNYGSSFSLSSIPPAQIERIEVYKGVVPGYLSEDALGGAINIVLKKLENTQKSLSASYSYGSFNTHQGNIDGSYRDSKTGFTVTASAFYNYTDNNYKVWGDKIYIVPDPNSGDVEHIKAKRFHDSYESYGVNANLGFLDVKWADRFTIGLLYSDMDKDVQTGATMNTVYGNRRTGQKTKMISLRYDKKDLLVKNLNFNSFVSYTDANRWVVDTVPYKYNWQGNLIWNNNTNDYWKWNNNGGESDYTLAENKEKTIAGRANVSYKLHAQHQLSANYFYNRFSRKMEDPLLPVAEQLLSETRYLTKQVIGLTYENNFFEERLKTSFFLKHYIQSVKLKDPQKNSNNEYISVEFDKTMDYDGYGIAVSYEVYPQILVQASYEKAVRMPESRELLGNTSEDIDANYELEPEKSNNYNLGFILGPFSLDQHRLRTNVNFFIRDIKDMITQKEENASSNTTGYENLNKIISRGFDAEIGYSYNNKLFINYNMSLFNARFNSKYDKNGNTVSYYKDRLRNAPYWTMNANAEYIFHNLFQKGSRTSVDYNFGYVHEFRYRWESKGGAGLAYIPTQKVHDLGIVYSFPKNKLALGFNIKNFTDEQVFDNWAQQKPGRAFFGKVTYKIF